jgi:endonuclease/exonuclease/phosphatase family metal-dependent hydrolase
VTVRLATFNLLHGMRPGDGRVDGDRLARAVAELDADVLGLQEVDRGQPRSGGLDQTALVAAACGAADWRFLPALRGTPGQDWTGAGPVGVVPDDELRAEDPAGDVGPGYGVGLVSRLPVRRWWALRLPYYPIRFPVLVGGRLPLLVQDEPRVAVAAQVALPDGGGLTVATTHLSFVPGSNLRQLRAVTRWLARLPGPRVLLGDLNLPGRVPTLVTGWPDLVRERTHPADVPRWQLDHVLTSQLHRPVVGTAVVNLGVSDHRAVRVDLA